MLGKKFAIFCFIFIFAVSAVFFWQYERKIFAGRNNSRVNLTEIGNLSEKITIKNGDSETEPFLYGKPQPEEQITINQTDIALLSEKERQDLCDDLLEKLDILMQQLIEIQQNQKPKIVFASAVGQEITFIKEDEVMQNSHPKILISEIQMGDLGDEKYEFMELYNPNDFTVDLTGWQIQRKTATGKNWSTYVSIGQFLGRKIPANGFILIARNGYYSGLPCIFVDKPITEDNSFIIKNQDGEIVDLVGFGNAQECQGNCAPNPFGNQSLGRKAPYFGVEQDTGDNSADFEIDFISPLYRNMPYIPQSIGGGGSVVADLDDDNVASSDEDLEIDITSSSIVSYEISNLTIYPSSEDASENSTEIDVGFSEKVKYKISIKSGEQEILYWSGEATNPRAKIWFGRYDKTDDGQIVPDGVYGVIISINGEVADNSKTITVASAI